MSNVEFREPDFSPVESTGAIRKNDSWFAGNLELPNGQRVFVYDSTGATVEQIQERLNAEYEAVVPIIEFSEKIARDLGTTAKNLLETALSRIDYESVRDTPLP